MKQNLYRLRSCLFVLHNKIDKTIVYNGRQFNLLNGYLQNISNKSISAFLKYLTNDIAEETESSKDFNYQYPLTSRESNNNLKDLLDINKTEHKFSKKVK